MSSCRDVTDLVGDVRTLGLFSDVGNLASERVRLRLRGGRNCRDVSRPFYEFDVIEVERNETVGDLTFMPALDADELNSLGHVGGGLRPDARGRGLYPEALRAIAPLARRHGLQEVVVSFPPDNTTAIRVADRMGLRPIAKSGAYVRFAMPVDMEAGEQGTRPDGA